MSDDMHRVAEELRRVAEMLHEMRMLNGRDELWAYERDMNALQQVHEAVQRAAALLEQQAAREQWQPIETAPKDGTPVLLFVPSSGECVVADEEV